MSFVSFTNNTCKSSAKFFNEYHSSFITKFVPKLSAPGNVRSATVITQDLEDKLRTLVEQDKAGKDTTELRKAYEKELREYSAERDQFTKDCDKLQKDADELRSKQETIQRQSFQNLKYVDVDFNKPKESKKQEVAVTPNSDSSKGLSEKPSLAAVLSKVSGTYDNTSNKGRLVINSTGRFTVYSWTGKVDSKGKADGFNPDTSKLHLLFDEGYDGYYHVSDDLSKIDEFYYKKR
jgi:hypothetical protein